MLTKWRGVERHLSPGCDGGASRKKRLCGNSQRSSNAKLVEQKRDRAWWTIWRTLRLQQIWSVFHPDPQASLVSAAHYSFVGGKEELHQH